MSRVRAAYFGSSGKTTVELFKALEAHGASGRVAIELFRAQKASERAKVYRGGGYRRMAYEKKNWAIENLVACLKEHSQLLGIDWGWREDSAQEYYKQVLYVDLPSGQASFHTDRRGVGPEYSKPWDSTYTSKRAIVLWIEQLLGIDGGPFYEHTNQTREQDRAGRRSTANTRSNGKDEQKNDAMVGEAGQSKLAI